MLTQTSRQKRTSPPVTAISSPRVIVLVPEADINLAHAANRICTIAAPDYEVLFIGFCSDAIREPALRRQMAALSALVENEKFHVRSRVEVGGASMNTIEAELQQDDIIVCFAGESTGLLKTPPNQVLASSTDAVIYVIDGLTRQAKRSSSGWISGVMAWLGSIAIILGLFWIQTQIAHHPTEWVKTLLLCISVLIEFWLVWLWNSRFN